MPFSASKVNNCPIYLCNKLRVIIADNHSGDQVLFWELFLSVRWHANLTVKNSFISRDTRE